MIYLDNAATSWPKPREVIHAMVDFLERAGGNPGRSGHRLSIEAGRVLCSAREAIAELFGAPDPLRVVFTHNATHAINIALRGVLRPGDRVVTSSMEHNAVMRPLRALEREGVQLAIVPCLSDGSLRLPDMWRALEQVTQLVVLNHASNVTGTLLPITEVASMAHRVGALVLVDAAQTGGVMPIDMQEMGIDLLAFTGHKGLQGPPGTGGLVIGNQVNDAQMEPLLYGGTGSYSEFEAQPEQLPDKLEAGTPNGAGIGGLETGVRFVMNHGIERIRAHGIKLISIITESLAALPGVELFGPEDASKRVAIVSFKVAGRRVSEIGLRLDEEFGILCRVGLHCAPAAHRTIGTFPEGTVRFAPGIFTTETDVKRAMKAMQEIVRQ